MIDQVISRYQVVKELGRGGMGIVYLAQDQHTGEQVAIKALRRDVAGLDGQWLARFQREGEALRDLNHPNIVKMLATCEENDQHFIIIEYLAGGSLADKLASSEDPLPHSETVDIALQIADALTRAHYLKIIHRDLKPANVLLASDGRACLTDFGIARTAVSELTNAGVLLGTTAYLSPEVIHGQEADERSDIWSFGVLLFELLSGQQPFRRQSPSGTLLAIISKPPPDLEALQPDLPAALVDLVYRMLAKDRLQRIPSVRLVGAALEAIQRGEALGEVLATPVSGRFTTPATGRPTRDNLPADLTPFVGRSKEMASLGRLLVDGDSRLVTATGPGGIGKTRLAIETARAIASNYNHGVAFVPLSPLTSAEALIPVIWEAVNYPPVHADTRSPFEQTFDFFRDKQMLLIFDNFEHVPEAAGFVADLLRAAPALRALVTSIERLNIQGETIVRLDGMDYPADPTDGGVEDYEAVQLFARTAARWRPGFKLSSENLPDVVRICQLVQGLPLGILLAAAWVDGLSVAEIADEITANADFLAVEHRDVPERQRSIRAVFEHAWQRLGPAEQETFRRLAVFRGGFNLEAAQAVAGASVRSLMSLVNKSLLWRDPVNGRYYSHRLLRQYAEEELANRDELLEIQRRHAEYFAGLAEVIDQKMREPDELPWYGKVREENANFSAALSWTLVDGQDPVIGGRLFGALGLNWFISDNVVDGTLWMERSLAYADRLPPAVRAKVYNRSGLIGCVQGSYAEAANNHAKAADLFRQLEDHGQLAYALATQANMRSAAGQRSAAFPLAEEGLNIAYQAEDPYFLAVALSTAASFYRLKGEERRARRLYLELFNLAESFPNQAITFSTKKMKAFVARREGQYDMAVTYLEEALATARQTGMRTRELDTLQELAYTHYLRGNLIEAETKFKDSLGPAREINHYDLIVWNLVGLGMLTLALGRDQEAGVYLSERLRLAHDTETSWQIAVCLAGLGKVAWNHGQADLAAQLLGTSEALVQNHELLPFSWFSIEWEQLIDELRPQLDENKWAEGRAMSLEAAVDYALSIPH